MRRERAPCTPRMATGSVFFPSVGVRRSTPTAVLVEASGLPPIRLIDGLLLLLVRLGCLMIWRRIRQRMASTHVRIWCYVLGNCPCLSRRGSLGHGVRYTTMLLGMLLLLLGHPLLESWLLLRCIACHVRLQMALLLVLVGVAGIHCRSSVVLMGRSQCVVAAVVVIMRRWCSRRCV